jgi:hypothetical protein
MDTHPHTDVSKVQTHVQSVWKIHEYTCLWQSNDGFYLSLGYTSHYADSWTLACEKHTRKDDDDDADDMMMIIILQTHQTL